MIDPGHGGSNSGAVGPNGQKEDEVVLDIGIMVRNLFKDDKNFEILLTRSSDVYPGKMSARKNYANNNKVDLVVYIHMNAYNKSAQVTETLYSTENKNGLKWATIVHKNVIKNIASYKFTNRQLKSRNNLSILKTNAPSCLIEGVFIDTSAGEKAMRTKEFRRAIAETIKKSIYEWFQK